MKPQNHPIGMVFTFLFWVCTFAALYLLFTGCAQQGPPAFERVQNPPRGSVAGTPFYINDDLIRSFP